MFDMKMLYLIILLMFFSFVCEAKNKESISDSIEIVSQIKADKVLSAFDSIKAAKLLYSIEDKYYYVIIQVSTLYYKEFFISLSDNGDIDEIRLILYEDNTRRKRKQNRQYKELLSKAEPIFTFDKKLSNDYITRIPNAKYIGERYSYFVLKDLNNVKYIEYRLPVITFPSPISAYLLAYLIRRLSDEIKLLDR